MSVLVDELELPGALPGVRDPARLAVLERTGLLDEEADPGLDRAARLAAALLQAPAAYVTLVAGDQQRAPGAVDADADAAAGPGRTLPMTDSICQYQIVTGEPLLIPDATLDPLTQHKGGVVDGSIRAYAGTPLSTRDGHVLGSLCVTDRVPRDWSAEQMALLEELGVLVSEDLEHRLAVRRSDEVQALGRRLGREVPALLDAVTSLVALAEQQDEPTMQRYAALTRRRSARVHELAAELADAEVLVPPPGSGADPLLDLRRAVERAVSAARDSTGTSDLRLDLPDDAPLVRCDPVLLERALVHLLVSALHHTGGVGLTVALVEGAPAAGQVELRLDGPSSRIPAGELARVVARFAEGVCGAAAPGTGPALRVVGGEVRARSGGVEGRSGATGLSFRAAFDLAAPRVIDLP